MNNIKIDTKNGIILITERQKEVYDLKAKGLTYREIAKELDISVKAVESRIAKINNYAGHNIFEVVKSIDNSSTSEPINEDFEKESNRYLKAQLKKLRREAGIEAQILNLFETTLKRYPNHTNFPILKNQKSKSSEELVVMLSDIHAGEIVKKKGVLGLNEYDMSIMEQRMQNIFNNVNSIIQDSTRSFKKLHVFLLGDLVSGIIHSELKEGVAMLDQVYVVASVIADMIYKWSQVFPEVDVSCVVGNHGRLDKPVVFKNKHDNFDGFVHHAIKIHLKNVTNVNVDIPECAWLVKNIQGKNFLLCHGENRAPGYNGIPWYKTDKMDTSVSRTLQGILDIKLDYICIGHFHDLAMLPRLGGGNIFVNGSVIGTSDFGLFAIYKGALPLQTMFRVHHKHGVNHIDKIRVMN